MRVLIVEDEPDLARVLARTCVDEGWVADIATDGPTGLTLAREGVHDVMVLDLMLPGLDGTQVLTTLRREGHHLPILILTARDGVPDRVRGLDAGADDYLTKPFDRDEWLARVRALVRRASAQPQPAITVGALRVDTIARRVRGPEGEIDLTAREYAILALLLRRRGRIVSRAEISDAVYADETEVFSNTIDVHIASLRRKLGAAVIETRRGLGYLIEQGP